MEMPHKLLELVIDGVDLIGVAIIIFGVLIVIWEMLVKLLVAREQIIQVSEDVRLKLGSQLLLSLEIFIGADIIRTITARTWKSLGVLCGIIVIRTVLSTSLSKEIKEQKELSAANSS